MPWLLNEDKALKKQLSGIKVSDTNAPNGRPVAVRFRLPETELAQLDYPNVIIEHAGLTKDDEREHRGVSTLGYVPEGWPAWDGLDPKDYPYKVEYPLPYNVDYQITVNSRKIQHHMALLAEMAKPTRLPARFGALDVPEDNTVRRVDLIGGPELHSEKDGQDKRIFHATYLVRVSTELVPEVVDQFHRVQMVEIDLTIYQQTYGSSSDA